jgi:lipoprotein-anchoring transpeptidase ErfK/SrfK
MKHLLTATVLCSLFFMSEAALAEKVFVFSPKKLMWFAYENGQLVNSGRASGGSGYCSDIKRSCRTPTGVFRVNSLGGPNCKSSRYPLPNGGAIMSYCMHFTKFYAIHASNSVPNYNASHGCIRVRPDAARWLNQNFMHVGTKVVVNPY